MMLRSFQLRFLNLFQLKQMLKKIVFKGEFTTDLSLFDLENDKIEIGDKLYSKKDMRENYNVNWHADFYGFIDREKYDGVRTLGASFSRNMEHDDLAIFDASCLKIKEYKIYSRDYRIWSDYVSEQLIFNYLFGAKERIDIRDFEERYFKI